MTRVLITGSEGFIGKAVVLALEELDLDLYTLDLLNNRDKHFQSDIASADIDSIVNSIKPDVIIHLAAQVVVSESFVDPLRDLEVNAKGTLKLVNASIKSGCKNFMYIGSGGAIYDSNSEMPLTEISAERPVSPYGLTKGLGEGYVRVLSEKAGTGWSSLALSNCYGPVVDHGRGVIFQFWKAISNGETPFINGINVTRDFVHLGDVVSAIILALGKPVNSRINISGGKEISLLQLYESVAKVMNSSVKPVLRDPVLGDILRSCLSNERAKSMLGWSPKIDLATGLKMSLIESVKTN